MGELGLVMICWVNRSVPDHECWCTLVRVSVNSECEYVAVLGVLVLQGKRLVSHKCSVCVVAF